MDSKERYAIQKKVLRLLLDFDYFTELNFDEFLASNIIDHQKLTIADRDLIKDIMMAKNTHKASQKYGALKDRWQEVKNKDHITNDFETVTKREADFALYMRLRPVKLGFNLKGLEVTPETEHRRINQLIYLARDSEEWGKIQPSEGQRCFVYIKINITNKEDVINRLKKAFSLLNITKVYGNPFLQKVHIYKELKQKYNELKAEENKA